jgi:hypothetical protein
MTVDLKQGLSFEEYQAIEALNPSLIKVGCKSMKHLRHAMHHPREPTEALTIGSACHTAVFEPAELDNRLLVFDGRRDKRTAEYQAVLAEAESTGKLLIRSKDLQAAADMGFAVASDPIVQPLIQAGKAEVTLTSEEHGVLVKGRLDWVCSGSGFCDLKTCRDITAYAFGAAFFRYGYDVSLGLYQRWLSEMRCQQEPCSLLCVENELPYDVAVVPVPQAVLDEGVAKGLRVIQRYKKCLENDTWPGIAQDSEYWLHTPQWAMAEADELAWGDAEVYDGNR